MASPLELLLHCSAQALIALAPAAAAARGDWNDCNANGVEDAVDIALGTSADVDRNGVPDECEARAPRAAPATDPSGGPPALAPQRGPAAVPFRGESALRIEPRSAPARPTRLPHRDRRAPRTAAPG